MPGTQSFTIDPNDPPTFEKVWAVIQATNEQMRETSKTIQEAWKQIKGTDKRIGELTNRFGDMVEHMVVPNLLAKFKALGFTFEVAHRNTEIKDEKNVTIQSSAGDSGNRRNEGAFSPEMSRLGAKGGGAPFVKALQGKKKF